jgi:6-phosphogluconolactonase/glucosamine-6-phosphate isomerase/deaminase
MEMRRFSDIESLNQYVGFQILEEFRLNPRSTHLLPTGNTYLGCYQHLINLLAKEDSLDFSELTLINLDEYVENWLPLSVDDSRSFAFYMKPIIQALVKFGFRAEKHIFPHSLCQNLPLSPYQQLKTFDQWVKGVTCASVFLGLGPKNSPHIAFCLPGYTKSFKQTWQEIGAYIGPVDEATRQANQSNYGMDDRNVPSWASTISPGTLLAIQPQRLYLVAYGKNKDLSVLDSSLDVGENPASILRILEQKGTKVEVITLQ